MGHRIHGLRLHFEVAADPGMHACFKDLGRVCSRLFFVWIRSGILRRNRVGFGAELKSI